jgi:hypothetical protein
MTPPFSVRTTPHFERLARALRRTHHESGTLQERAVEILSADPHNRSRAHHIKKLEAVPLGDGQWRLSLGRFRFVMMSTVARSCSSTAAFVVRTHTAKRLEFNRLVSLEHEAFGFAQI